MDCRLINEGNYRISPTSVGSTGKLSLFKRLKRTSQANNIERKLSLSFCQHSQIDVACTESIVTERTQMRGFLCGGGGGGGCRRRRLSFYARHLSHDIPLSV